MDLSAVLGVIISLISIISAAWALWKKIIKPAILRRKELVLHREENSKRMQDALSKLDRVLKEVLPNGGSSLRDSINRVEKNINNDYIDDIFIIKNIVRKFGNDGGFIELIVGDSEQFVFDKAKEISQKIQDLNEKTPKAEIFNEGIVQITSNNINVNIENEVILKKATIPQDILIHNLSREYINSTATPKQTYKYIKGGDYINLFEDIT